MKTIAELETRLARPSADLVGDMAKLEGDIVVVGAGGKLGPSLVKLAVNALREAGSASVVHAVSRFSSSAVADELDAAGARIVRADITDESALASLPDAANVVYLVGEKFGSATNQASTWATNAYLPGRIVDRYQGSRISALSTGTVYPLVDVGSGGSVEEDALGPIGDYAMSCVGRERVMTHLAAQSQTPLALIRLNYAVELRYGVLIDIASMVNAGAPIDVSMGSANVVWQGYANEVTLRALLHASVPPFVLNVTGPETFSVRYAAQRLGRILGREPEFTGSEGGTAFLSNAAKCFGLFGYPTVTLDSLIEMTAEWVAAGGETHGKPTKFQKRDGAF